MGERNSVYVYKGCMPDDFRDTATSVVVELGGRLEWDVHPDPMDAAMLTSHRGLVHAAYIHLKEGEIAKRIGSRLAIPWINIRIQEGSLWDYSLFHGEPHLDNFSTLPEYWEEDDQEWLATQRGKLDVLARTWQVEESAIANYLKSWGYELIGDAFRTTLRGKAYENDRHEYGDIWQMTDFLRALGAHDPNWGEPHSVPRLLEFPSKRRP
jgi:hypothetical protein